MTYEEAVAQLRNHSNLTRGEDGRSLLYELWKADREGVAPDLTPHVNDILVCLAVANVELNGGVPSETFGVQNSQVVADLAYPVSGLVVDLLARHRQWSASRRLPPAVLEAVRDAALRIGMAWNMLLAGDHDDLVGELELEWNDAV